MATRRKTSRKYGKAASKSVEQAMRRRKRGTLRSGPKGRGGKVTSREQAVAIGLSEAREKGAKVPKKATKRSAKRTTKRSATNTATTSATKRAKKSTKRTARKSASRSRSP